MKNIFALVLGLAWFCPSFDASAADLALKLADKAPPKDLDPSITAKLQPKAIQLLDGGKAVYEFWLVAELPLKATPDSLAKALDQIREAALLGVVTVAEPQRDYRDDELASGVYTMRFALQPQDGNHLGTAEFNYFAVLVPAKLDRAPDSITDYKKLVRTSGRETASGHPLIISLRPASDESGDLPKLNAPVPEHKTVRVKVPAKVISGGAPASAIFELVYEGKGHK